MYDFQKLEKVGVIFSLAIHVSHPKSPHPLSDFAAQKSSHFLIFLAASEVQQLLFCFYYSCFFLLASFFSPSYTAAFPLSPKHFNPL